MQVCLRKRKHCQNVISSGIESSQVLFLKDQDDAVSLHFAGYEANKTH